MSVLIFAASVMVRGSSCPEGTCGCPKSGAPLESGLGCLVSGALQQIQSMSPGRHHPGLPIWVVKMHVAEQAAVIRPPWLGGTPIPCAVQQLSGAELGGIGSQSHGVPALGPR